MHWKLFFTLVAAILTGYLIIRWLKRSDDELLCHASSKPSREVGFHTALATPAFLPDNSPCQA